VPDITKFTIELAKVLKPTPLTDEEEARLKQLYVLKQIFGMNDPRFPQEEFAALLFKENPKEFADSINKNKVNF
jgi:predicted Zn-dependent peptidase